MGIDIYAVWKDQSDDEKHKQASVWLRSDSGGKGYLREVYHGGPYATKFLVAEAFERGQARITAAILEERLPETLALAEERERKLYNSTDEEVEEVKQSYRDFVALCKERERETGEPVSIVASY